jgi:hypothetical protein
MILLRKFRRHFGISARKVAVQTRLAWYWRWALIALASGMLAGAGWFAYRASVGFTSPGPKASDEETIGLREQLQSVEQENARLRAELAASERQLKIEAATRVDMTRQLKGLGDEVSSAKDETAVLQALLVQGGKSPGLSITRFRVQRDGDAFRYRLTLVQPAGGAREFQGQLRLVANLIQDGRPVSVPVPEAGIEGGQPTALSFSLFQPVEGTFRVPSNATLRSLEVRVFENGTAQPRAIQTALVS